MAVKRKQPIDAPAKPTVAPQQDDDFAAFESASEDESSKGSNGGEGQERESGESEDETEMSPETRQELLRGFDSDSDSEDEGVADKEDNRIIELSNLTPDINSALSAKKKKKAVDESGVLYIGRIPHGFYEEEMTSYFSQFGTILNLRMSRSKKTGRSRHFAFIEFSDRGVAEIVAQTMHNYLLAGRLLQVILLTQEEYRKKGGKELFKGAGKKFKAVPWAQIAKERVEAPKTKEQWSALQQREEKRRVEQAKKIKDAGIDYEYVPAAKKIKSAPAQTKMLKSKKEVDGAGQGTTRKTSAAKVAGGRKASSTKKVGVK